MKFSFLNNDLPNISTWESDDLDYNPFDLSGVQAYYPIYKLFSDYNPSNYNSTFETNFTIASPTHVMDSSNTLHEKPIFFKYGPLLDPCHYLIGKYKHQNHHMPCYSSEVTKINNIHNATYVDNFCYFLISKILHSHNFFHAIDYYGSYLAYQKEYKIDIIDDLEYIQGYDFFHENLSKLFHTSVFQHTQFNHHNSRKNKPVLNFDDNDNDDLQLDFETLDESTHDESIDGIELVYENDNMLSNSNHDNDDSDNSVISVSDDENDENDEDSENSDNDDSSTGDDLASEEVSSVEEEPLYAYIYNFPVQMICMEKCEDTFDSLLHQDVLDEDSARSAIFQVIMILLSLQKAFKFTHNDLHTNNIMYSKTDHEFIYYIYKDQVYKVPTFGRIFKIIDFGRAIYTFNNMVFCSDSFEEGGDGHGQYNTEPFFDSSKKRIDPNFSFDLCRLGCSIYDFVIDSEMSLNDMDGFQKLVVEWCTDDDGKNILYKKNGDERYPNFKLYKMIARLVHKHTPSKQLQNPFFQTYLDKGIPENTLTVLNLDEIPSYVESIH